MYLLAMNIRFAEFVLKCTAAILLFNGGLHYPN